MKLLSNPIRPYAWGSPTTIPSLLGETPTGEPQAELWMGAHPASPSLVDGRSLVEVLAADPAGELGSAVVAEFGVRLPFLMKLIAAAAPLSIQAHPSPAQAREGFERENDLGIPLDAPQRNYKDPYAKPEMLCALAPTELLMGFRSAAEVESDLGALGVDLALPGTVRELFVAVLQDDAVRREWSARLTAACADSSLPLASLVNRLGTRYPDDPGVVAALLMNHLVLQPGTAVYLPAGNLHAYIEGFGVELLANSDNVLRGGLTPKHIDVPELLKVVDFTPTPPDILSPQGSGPERVFETGSPEFRMSVIEVGLGVVLPDRGPQILLCTKGSVTASSALGKVSLGPGRSAFAAARDGEVSLDGDGTVFRATVGRV